MQGLVFLNGKFVKAGEAKVSAFSRGFLYGEGVFETMRSYGGVIFKLDAHIKRLFYSSKQTYLNIPYGKDRLKTLVYLTLKKNSLKDAYVRIAVWRKEQGFGLDFKSRGSEILLLAQPLKKSLKRVYKKGIRAALSGKTRKNVASPISNIKSFNYLENIIARKKARLSGFDEIIFLNARGFISEASSSNIFVVKRGALITPPVKAGILCGIARGVVMALVKRCLFDVFERNINARELFRADEIFLTNSLSEIVPVVEVDGRRIGSGAPGELTRLLALLYRLEAEKEAQISADGKPRD